MKAREIVFRIIEILIPILAIYFAAHYLRDDPEFVIEVIVIPMLVILLCELLQGKYVSTPEPEQPA